MYANNTSPNVPTASGSLSSGFNALNPNAKNNTAAGPSPNPFIFIDPIAVPMARIKNSSSTACSDSAVVSSVRKKFRFMSPIVLTFCFLSYSLDFYAQPHGDHPWLLCSFQAM